MDDQNQEVELHDDDEEIVGEAAGHDMKKAEEQSVDSVAKTDDNIKQAPARKGDKRNSEKMPKTKAGKVQAMYDKINLIKKEDLEMAYNVIMGETYLDENTDEGEDVHVEVNFEDDLNALVESEATLSEEFKGQATVIFEAALNSRISKEVDRLEEAFRTELDEELSNTKEGLIEDVNSYLNYAVETFMEQNKLAIQNGLRTEIAENFMQKLKGLFEESYIDVPETKVDMVDELAEQIDELEEAMNQSTTKMIAMTDELEGFRRADIVAEEFDGLSETQAAKLVELTENVEFNNVEEFTEKVKALKESYFKTASKSDSTIVEETGEEEGDAEASSPRMDAYLSALKKR